MCEYKTRNVNSEPGLYPSNPLAPTAPIEHLCSPRNLVLRKAESSPGSLHDSASLTVCCLKYLDTLQLHNLLLGDFGLKELQRLILI